MDDVTNERFRRIEERLTKVESAVEGMESRLSGKLDNVARGFDVALQAVGKGFQTALTEAQNQIVAHVDVRFGDTMRKFQEVAEDRHRTEELEARIAKLEALLAERGSH
jgi:ribosomal protein L6P/L9E